MPQINKGDTFADGQQVTGVRLNGLVDSATLMVGAITDQPSITPNTLESTDSTIVNDGGVLKEATIGDILNSNLPVTTSSVASGTNSDITVTPSNGTTVVGVAYVSADGITVTVTSNAHGLLAGHVILVTLAGTGYNGTFRVSTAATNTFTYVLERTATAGSGTFSYTKKGVLRNAGGEVISGSFYADGPGAFAGPVSFNTTSAIKIPVGTTAQRPATPVIGEIRYNTNLLRSEIYNGTEWKAMGISPFDGTGGNVILEPSNTVSAATFTSTNGGKNITVSLPSHNYTVGQVVEMVTTTAGYSREYVIISATSTSFSFINAAAGLSNVTSVACTVRKSGNHRVHIYKTSGTFVTGMEDGYAEVLLVGGGGGVDTTPRWNGKGGGSGGLLHRKQVFFQKNTTYTIVVGAGGTNPGGDSAGTSGGASRIHVQGQPDTSFVWAGGGTAGTSGDSGWSGTNSDGATQFQGTTFGDWANWGSAGTGASSTEGCVPRNGSDSGTSAYTNRTWPSGYISDITNVPVMYGMAGGDGACTKTFDDNLRLAMRFTGDDSRGFHDIGHGGCPTHDDGASTGRYFYGRAGIVIIRYGYALP
jgi:hypothetical protein